MSAKTELYAELGHDYTDESLEDAAFLFREIAILGYSISVTSTTLEDYVQLRASHGLQPEAEAAEFLAEHKCFYTYQLKGREIEKRGDHNSPIMESPIQALQVALYNVIKLYGE